MKKFFCISTTVLITIISLTAFAVSNAEVIGKIVPFKILVNGIEKQLEHSVVTIDDNTYIPLRELSEIIGVKVDWNADTQSVLISETENNDFTQLYPFENDEGLWGYKDSKGNIAINARYYGATEFKEGLAVVTTSSGQDGQEIFIDASGKQAIPGKYHNAMCFSEGIAEISLETGTDKPCWTYIDRQGNRICDKIFEVTYPFSEGYALVLKEGTIIPTRKQKYPPKWSFIDKKGNFATEQVFDEARSFKNGYAYVKKDSKWGVINSRFELVVPYKYDDIDDYNNGLFKAHYNNAEVYVDTIGNELGR